MYNHVLVPLDQSKLAEKAIPYALHSVSPQGKITFLMAFQDPGQVIPYAGDMVPIVLPTHENDLLKEMQTHSENYLANVIADLPQSDLTIEQSVQMADPADAIVDYAEESDVDLIVMCTHGRTGVNRWLMGSVTQKVLTVAPCPVIVIPSRIVTEEEAD